MNRTHILSLVCFLIGCILLGYGFIQGQISFGLIVFIPFFIGSGLFATLGFVMVFLGMILFYLGHLQTFDNANLFKSSMNTGEKNQEVFTGKKSVKTGGIILIGPIPIVFGSTKKMLVSAFIIAVILLIIVWGIIPMLLTY
jgi:uncharacterized protein (TIGR00304 family)